ncbi:hypothetical protein Q7C36_009835 [Tachysurus vachellii]|uniref:Uncharacterized protein n=1 Tax=Tachysurus vachellii TaxID=175792 RepID=A0AA88N2R0_TACVA|nr:hypothetical protein Q7C36_009835 [Tachysurus vachellii]
MSSIISKAQSRNQDGSGLALISRGKSKRPPGHRHVIPNKRRRVTKTKTSVKKNKARYTYIEIPPLSALTDNGPLEFFVAGNGEDYLDLNNTFLHVACKIVIADGTNIANDAKVGVVNYPIASLFSQVDVMLGDRLISQSSNTYPYRAIFECLLNYGKDTLETQFCTGLFYKDTARYMDATDHADRNEGLKRRARFSAESNTFDLTGHIHSDIFFQDKLLLNGVDLRIKMVRSKDEFCLLKEGNINFALKILNASLFVKKVSVSPSVKLGHVHALLSSTAKYSLERVCMKTFSLAAGSRICSQENLFLGPLPKTIIFDMVDNDAFSGSYNKNPFNFKHYDAEFVALYIDGTQYPAKPFQPDLKSDNAVREFYSLILASGKQLKDQPLAINREEYSRGYTLFAFNLNPDDDCGQHLSLIKSGNMRMELRFRQALPRTVNLIVYASFDSILEINNRRNVLIDYQ